MFTPIEPHRHPWRRLAVFGLLFLALTFVLFVMGYLFIGGGSPLSGIRMASGKSSVSDAASTEWGH